MSDLTPEQRRQAEAFARASEEIAAGLQKLADAFGDAVIQAGEEIKRRRAAEQQGGE